MKISEMLQEQLKDLCEIQSNRIEKLKTGQASAKDIETLKMTSELINETVNTLKTNNNRW